MHHHRIYTNHGQYFDLSNQVLKDQRSIFPLLCFIFLIQFKILRVVYYLSLSFCTFLTDSGFEVTFGKILGESGNSRDCSFERLRRRRRRSWWRFLWWIRDDRSSGERTRRRCNTRRCDIKRSSNTTIMRRGRRKHSNLPFTFIPNGMPLLSLNYTIHFISKNNWEQDCLNEWTQRKINNKYLP